jgi:hypothetical protein
MNPLFLATYVALWILTATLCLAVVLIYRHFGRQLLETEQRKAGFGPKLNEKLNLTLDCVDGRSVAIGNGEDAGHVVVFTAPNCSACSRIQPVLREVLQGNSAKDLVLVHHRDSASARDYVENMPGRVFAVADPGRELARLWHVAGTPFAVVIDSKGIVRSKGSDLLSRSSTEQIKRLFN